MERPNEQTQLIEKDLQTLSNRMGDFKDSVDKQFTDVKAEQRDQWDEIKKQGTTLIDVRLEIMKIGTRAAVYATLGSAVGTAVVSTLVGIILYRILS